MNLEYFKISDFDSPDEIGSGENMKRHVLTALDSARRWIQNNWNKRGKQRFVMIINSGYRTPSHNKIVGGNKTSSHPKGVAVDIRFKSPTHLIVMIIALSLNGFFRFGINYRKRFLHADMDTDKRPSIWFYGTKLSISSIFGKTQRLEEDI